MEHMQVWQATYLPNGDQVWMFPNMAVFARSYEEAVEIAGAQDRQAMWDQCVMLLDSAEAQSRLGTWGDPEAARKIERGD